MTDRNEGCGENWAFVDYAGGSPSVKVGDDSRGIRWEANHGHGFSKLGMTNRVKGGGKVDISRENVLFVAFGVVIRGHELLNLAMCTSVWLKAFLAVMKKVVLLGKCGECGGDYASPKFVESITKADWAIVLQQSWISFFV